MKILQFLHFQIKLKNISCLIKNKYFSTYFSGFNKLVISFQFDLVLRSSKSIHVTLFLSPDPQFEIFWKM